MTVQDAVAEIVGTAGLPTDAAHLFVSDSDFDIPSVPAGGGDWNFVISAENGDTAAAALSRLLDAYYGNWLVREWPGVDNVRLEFISPDDLPTAPDAFVYDDRAAALTGGVLAADVWKAVYREYREYVLPCEATQLTVIGRTPRTGKAIWTTYRDADAENPELAPSARPGNWWGMPIKYGYIEPFLTTQAACDRAAETLRDRLTKRRVICELGCEMQTDPAGFPSWRANVLDVQNTSWSPSEARIMSIYVSFEKEPNDAQSDTLQWRTTRYTLQYLEGGDNPGTSTRTSGTTAEAILAAYQLRLTAKVIRKPGAERIIGGPPVLAAEL